MDILCPGQHRVNILASMSQVATDTHSLALLCWALIW